MKAQIQKSSQVKAKKNWFKLINYQLFTVKTVHTWKWITGIEWARPITLFLLRIMLVKEVEVNNIGEALKWISLKPKNQLPILDLNLLRLRKWKQVCHNKDRKQIYLVLVSVFWQQKPVIFNLVTTSMKKEIKWTLLTRWLAQVKLV